MEPPYWYLPIGPQGQPPRLLTWSEYSDNPFGKWVGINYSMLLPITFLAEVDWTYEFADPKHQARWEESKRYLRRPGVYEYLHIPIEERPLWSAKKHS
ncbi:hypothetical protein [Solirubrum puertoriconensis]|uniref:Uncharacterized protein n=1 Tax=Solirubrum puertoriconensis TaxID=1751427 RepID=A0A9X0HJ63_SOLP1|nr:hypothetical protein [Solirubrum puertoriconensis]KUG06870.1 hypothetical protein ASU33_05975 [Solirubrum puertoriconensis]